MIGFLLNGARYAGSAIVSGARWLFTPAGVATTTVVGGTGLLVSDTPTDLDALDPTTPSGGVEKTVANWWPVIAIAGTVVGLIASGLYIYREMR